MNEKSMNLALKFDRVTKHNEVSHEVVPEHNSIADSEGSVWWGKTVKWGKEGSGIAEWRIEKLKEQLRLGVVTKVFLFENKPSVRAFQTEMIDITRDFSKVDENKIPAYYRDTANETEEYYLELKDFREIDRTNTLLSLRRFDDPEDIGFLTSFDRGQSPRFYVIESDTSVYDLINTVKENAHPDSSGREPSPAKSRFNLTETLVSDPRVVKWIKDLYKGECQICNNIIKTPKGNYSEAAHIRAKRDKGDDHEENVLSLCPNCHKQFDKGAIWLNDNLDVIHYKDGQIGKLTINSFHTLNLNNIKFHREKFSTP